MIRFFFLFSLIFYHVVLSAFLDIYILSNIFYSWWFITYFPTQKVIIFSISLWNVCFKHVRIIFATCFLWCSPIKEKFCDSKCFLNHIYFNKNAVKNSKNCLKISLYVLCMLHCHPKDFSFMFQFALWMKKKKVFPWCHGTSYHFDKT